MWATFDGGPTQGALVVLPNLEAGYAKKKKNLKFGVFFFCGL
jgi:hypothetical protein